MAAPKHICARPSLLERTLDGNQKSFALAHRHIAKEPGSFALCVRTDDYRRDDNSELDIRAGDALLFKALSVEDEDSGTSYLGIRPMAGDCVLARRKNSHGYLVLLEARENGGGELRDLSSGELAERDSFTLLGVLHEKRRSYRGESYEGEYDDPRDDSSIEVVAFARMAIEETLADGDAVLWAMCMAAESPLVSDLRAEFEATYNWKPGDPGPCSSIEEAKDYAFHILSGQLFRAGQLAQ